jgi:uroporphyrinogen decarboxylase
MKQIVPARKPTPDAREMIDILAGKSSAKRVPLIEYIVDDVIVRPVVTDLLGRQWAAWGDERTSQARYLDNMIAFWTHMGYDVVRFEIGLPFRERLEIIKDASPFSSGTRAWPDEHTGTVGSWREFEEYAWPEVSAFDFFPYQYLNDHLPEGMGLIACHAGGVYEHLSWIMSFEGLCTALYEDLPLVKAVAEALGKRMVEFYRHLLDLDRLVAIFPGDDMGYRTGTMVSPDTLRSLILPWHKTFASMAHQRSLPYFLHSCGNVLAIMEDLIEDVRIDGKHSFEDAIIPVEDFQATYGSRIAVLGGVDINILGGSDPLAVRRRVRHLLELCGTRGRYAMGSGNSIPSYIPVENYLAMIEETHAFNAGVR